MRGLSPGLKYYVILRLLVVGTREMGIGKENWCANRVERSRTMPDCYVINIIELTKLKISYYYYASEHSKLKINFNTRGLNVKILWSLFFFFFGGGVVFFFIHLRNIVPGLEVGIARNPTGRDTRTVCDHFKNTIVLGARELFFLRIKKNNNKRSETYLLLNGFLQFISVCKH